VNGAHQRQESRLRDAWRTRSALAGYWASATGGAWSGLLNSYAPVVLARAGQSSSTIGFIISCANAGNILGSVVVGRLPRRHVTIGYVACIATAGLGTVLIGLMAHLPPLTSVALVLSGFGAGALLTRGPTLATDGVRPENRPDALAAAGTFRAGLGQGRNSTDDS
jgi:MFS family permease